MAIIELDEQPVGSVKLLQFLLSIVVKGPCEGMFRELGRSYDASFCELRIFKIVKTVSKTKTAVTACGCDTLQWMAVRSITKFAIYCICVWWGCPPTSEWQLRVRFDMYGLWQKTFTCILVLSPRRDNYYFFELRSALISKYVGLVLFEIYTYTFVHYSVS